MNAWGCDEKKDYKALK